MKRLFSLPKGPTELGWFLTVLVGGLGVNFLLFMLTQKHESPSLGDWGDYFGGLVSSIALIWLVVAHTAGERRLNDSQEDMRVQLSLTQGAVASLSTLAESAHTQLRLIAAQMAPVFVSTSSSGGTIGAGVARTRPNDWTVAFRNEGGTVFLGGVEGGGDGVDVTLESSGMCPKGGVFRIVIMADESLNTPRLIAVRLAYRDFLSQESTVLIRISFPDGGVSVEVASDGLSAPSRA